MILNEKLISTYNVERKPIGRPTEKFSLQLTNYRVFLITPPEEKMKNAKYKFFYQDLKHECSTAVDRKGGARYLCRISVNNFENIFLRFQNLDEMSSFEREITVLKTLLDEVTRIKFKLLAEDEALYKSYESLVTKSIVSEEEFWSQKEEIREWNKISSMAAQPLARTSKNHIKSIYTGGNTRIEGLKLDEIGKMRLLKRETALMKHYLKEVQEKGMKDADFWKDFEKKQIEKNTVLVGGVNPIYVEGNDNDDQETLKIQVDLEVDIMKNTESFDLTERLFQPVKDDEEEEKKKKKILIEKFNERNIRVLNEELLKEKVIFHEESFPEIIEKPDSRMISIKENLTVKPNINIRENVRESERKMYVWEEEAMENLRGQFQIYEKESSNYKKMVFKEENKQIRNVFEQMMKTINQRLSKKGNGFSNNDDEFTNFQNFQDSWKLLHQESNKVLSFFYLNLKKAASDPKNSQKYFHNCKEIAVIIAQLKEKLHKIKYNPKVQDFVLKCLNNLHDRLDTALKQQI